MTFAKELLKRPIVVASAIGVVVLLIVWWFAWMSPQGAKLASVRAQQVQANATRSALLFRLEELHQDSKNEKAAAAYIARFNKAIPSSADAPGLVVQVYNLAQGNGVKLLSVTDDSLLANTGYSTIPVSIEVSGGHDNVMAFVAGLYKLPRLVTVQSLSLSGGSNVNQSSSQNITASLSATAYTLAAAKSSLTNS